MKTSTKQIFVDFALITSKKEELDKSSPENDDIYMFF